MANPLSQYLADMQGGPGPGGPTSPFLVAYLTEWDPTTRKNTVSIGTRKLNNLGTVNPTLLSVGPVLLLSTPGRRLIILGRYYPYEGA